MNEVISQLYGRKSTRVFENREICAEDQEEILNAAFAAPSAGCQQLYTVIRVTDPTLRETLAESCDHQPFIATAKMILIFCADVKKWYDAFVFAGCEPRKPAAGDFLLAVNDAVIAAQNAVTAAESLGIGSCYIGDIMENYEFHRKLLNLPEYVFPAAMLVFGYPTDQQKARTKPRRAPKELIVHENGYRPMEEAELQTLFSAYASQREYGEWIRAFCKRKYNSDFSVEMSRSVNAFLKTLDE